MKPASTDTSRSPLPRMLVSALLGWAVPGAGHLYVGDRGRGLIFLVAIALTFWGGVAIGGVKNTVNPQERALWFLGQACAGVHPFVAIAWGRQIEVPPEADKFTWIAYGQMEDISVVYTAIAGMLNVLVILDVLGRAERPAGAQGGVEVRVRGGRSGP